jgi:hypothetical protein
MQLVDLTHSVGLSEMDVKNVHPYNGITVLSINCICKVRMLALSRSIHLIVSPCVKNSCISCPAAINEMVQELIFNYVFCPGCLNLIHGRD